MELTATTSEKGGPIQLQLFNASKQIIMELVFTSTDDNKLITRSVSSIKDLQVGDKVTLECTNSSMNGINGDGVAFLGLLLYPS